jgi:hypothetical protein
MKLTSNIKIFLACFCPPKKTQKLKLRNENEKFFCFMSSCRVDLLKFFLLNNVKFPLFTCFWSEKQQWWRHWMTIQKKQKKVFSLKKFLVFLCVLENRRKRKKIDVKKISTRQCCVVLKSAAVKWAKITQITWFQGTVQIRLYLST